MTIQKLSGGNSLACGHNQVISTFRYAAYQAGIAQRPVWCVECDNWVEIIPSTTSSTEAETVDNVDDPVLD